MPIFVYRCDSGHRVARLVARDAAAPACPECGAATRKIPAGPSLARGAAGTPAPSPSSAGSVPIPWRGMVSGGPEKVQREVELRQRLAAKAGPRTPGGPERPTTDGAGSSGPTPPASG